MSAPLLVAGVDQKDYLSCIFYIDVNFIDLEYHRAEMESRLCPHSLFVPLIEVRNHWVRSPTTQHSKVVKI